MTYFLNKCIRYFARLFCNLLLLFGIDLFRIWQKRWFQKVVVKSCPRHEILQSNGFGLFFDVKSVVSLSKVCRDLAIKLYHSGIPVAICDTRLPKTSAATIHPSDFSIFQPLLHDIIPFKKVLFSPLYDQAVSSPYESYTQVWWEFSTGFSTHRPDFFKTADRAIVFSEFCENAIRESAPSGFPIIRFPYPFLQPRITKTETRESIRHKYGIPQDSFAVFFNFNWNSSPDRKNPEAVISAFSNAFKLQEQAVLVLKTTQATEYPSWATLFREKIGKLGIGRRVFLIEETLSEADVFSLTAACDTYISLHRGEGLGLGMLEAMSLGVPVIATGYGGNMEFTNPNTSCIVPYKLVPCKSNYPAFRGVEKWPEPDIEAASYYLRKLYDSSSYRTTLAEKGKLFVSEKYSCNLFSQVVKPFLES